MSKTKIDNELLKRILTHSNRYDVSTIVLVHHGLKNGGMIDIKSSNQSELEAILKELELHPEPFKGKRQAYYFIWHDNSIVPQQEARETMYRELDVGNRIQIGASFLDIPNCCNDAWDIEKSYEHYRRQLSELFRANGIKAIKPFVGIKHAPCTINCSSTLNLGYSSFLRRNYPNIYLVELIILRKDMVKL